MGEVVPAHTLADPTSPIPSHCAVIILFQSVPVHQLSRLALISTCPYFSADAFFHIVLNLALCIIMSALADRKIPWISIHNAIKKIYW